MARIKWDQVGEKVYETGTNHGVMYKSNGAAYDAGVAWNGLTGVTDSPSGAEITSLYADNIKYANLQSAEEWGGTIEAYTYPKEFYECNGVKELAPGVFVGQQKRKSFGFAYETIKGNDTDGQAYGKKIHVVYGCLTSPSDKSYSTVNDNPDAVTFSFEVKATPVTVTGMDPTATVEIDSTYTEAGKFQLLENALFGADGGNIYTEFTGAAFEKGVVYFERTGTEGAYVYTPTEDTTKQAGTTYYTNGEMVPTLLMPDEIAALVGNSANPGNG